MRTCCCILAGTKACDNCSNRPSNSSIIMKMSIFPGEVKPKKKYIKTWTSTSLK